MSVEYFIKHLQQIFNPILYKNPPDARGNFERSKIIIKNEVLYKDLIFRHEYLLYQLNYPHSELELKNNPNFDLDLLPIKISYSCLDELTPLCLKLFHDWVHFNKSPLHKPWTVWDIFTLRNFAFKYKCERFWYHYRWSISVWMTHKKRVKKGYTEIILKSIPEMYYVNYYYFYAKYYNDPLVKFISYNDNTYSLNILKIKSAIISYLKNNPLSNQTAKSNLINLATNKRTEIVPFNIEIYENIIPKKFWNNAMRYMFYDIYRQPIFKDHYNQPLFGNINTQKIHKYRMLNPNITDSFNNVINYKLLIKLSYSNPDYVCKYIYHILFPATTIRLNPYEGIENQQINYRINLNPRKFKGTFGDSKQKFNPVKSYEDTNSKNKFNRQPQTTNTFNPVGSLSSQPQQLGLQNQNNLNYLQQSQQSNFSRPPQNI